MGSPPPLVFTSTNKVYGGMATVGSRAIRSSHEYVRKAGANREVRKHIGAK